jgi:hypothetical protein
MAGVEDKKCTQNFAGNVSENVHLENQGDEK